MVAALSRFSPSLVKPCTAKAKSCNFILGGCLAYAGDWYRDSWFSNRPFLSGSVWLLHAEESFMVWQSCTGAHQNQYRSRLAFVRMLRRRWRSGIRSSVMKASRPTETDLRERASPRLLGHSGDIRFRERNRQLTALSAYHRAI